MIKKIISGGQTGAGQAALDAAMQWRIPHGGWIPRGRKTEAGRLPAKYKLTEMTTDSDTRSTDQNIIDSDGTLIVSHGELSGEVKYTQEKAQIYKKFCIHIDLEKINAFQAAHVVKKWLADNHIETLHVAGRRTSEDRYIYQVTMRLLTAVFHMQMIESEMPDLMNPSSLLPETIEEVIGRLIDELPLRDRFQIANMKQADLLQLHPTLGSYVRNKYLWNGNDSLIMDCVHKSGNSSVDENEASLMIIKALWEELKNTHRLRAVK